MKWLARLFRPRLTPAPTKQEIAWAELEADMKRNLEEHEAKRAKGGRMRDGYGRFSAK